MKLSSKIKIHPLTVTIFLLGMLTGYFRYLVYIFMIVLIHELGHVFIARRFKRKIVSIELLPFGGLTKLEGKISDDIFEDLLIAVGGILFQTILGYILIYLNSRGLMKERTFAFMNSYNRLIIGFNLLPICPLDGYKLMKLLTELFIPYGVAYIIALVVSTCFLGVMGIKNMQLIKDNIFVFIFLIAMIIEEIRMKKYAKIKFYMERMNYNFNYSRINIHHLEFMFKNRTNYIGGVHEREYLKARFTGKID